MHDNYRRALLARPSVVSPRFSQAMTGDFAFYAYCYYCRMDDPPSLYPTDGLAFLAVTDKNKIATPVWKVQEQRLEKLFGESGGARTLDTLLKRQML